MISRISGPLGCSTAKSSSSAGVSLVCPQKSIRISATASDLCHFLPPQVIVRLPSRGSSDVETFSVSQSWSHTQYRRRPLVSVSGIAAITSLVPGVVVSRSLVAVWIAILLGPCREERVLIPPGFPTWTSCIAVVLPAQQSSFLHFYHLLVIVPNSRGTLVIVVFVRGRVVIIHTSF